MTDKDNQQIVREWYAQQTRMFPDPRLTFMNYGYLDENPSFEWLRAEDWEQKCSTNLIHTLLDGTDLTHKHVLEIGCGRGGNCSYLARYTNAAKIAGLDFCDAHIEFCQKVHKFNNVSFYLGDAQALPFEGEQFDVVINIESSHAYPDMGKFGREVYRVLKSKGTFFYADTMLGDKNVELSKEELVGVEYFTRGIQEFESMIANSGFTIHKDIDITNGVIRSFESKEGNLKHLQKKLLDEKKQVENIPDHILQSLDVMFNVFDVTGLNAYKKGYLIYKYWQLHKS